MDARPGADATTDAPRYDTIGVGYRRHRQPDPRIAATIDAALGDATTLLDVGSGTGSYEPPGRSVVAIEPSLTMIDQRPPDAAPVVQGVAERLPFPDSSFDAALAVFTVHHWNDPVAGLHELARVARQQVVVTWDPLVHAGFWLVEDYLPEIAVREAQLPTLDAVTDVLAIEEVKPITVPADCTDGFCGAYWRRPAKYLDPDVRRAISAFSDCRPGRVVEAMTRLDEDLASGPLVTPTQPAPRAGRARPRLPARHRPRASTHRRSAPDHQNVALMCLLFVGTFRS
jgi:SAM-dependent methyltransferase